MEEDSEIILVLIKILDDINWKKGLIRIRNVFK